MLLRVSGALKLGANRFLELKIPKSLLNVFKNLTVGTWKGIFKPRGQECLLFDKIPVLPVQCTLSQYHSAFEPDWKKCLAGLID